jgi:hypothetical protein
MPHCPACTSSVAFGVTKCGECGAPFDAPALGLLESRLSPNDEAALPVPTWFTLNIGILGIGGAAWGFLAIAMLVAQGPATFGRMLLLVAAALLYLFGGYCGVLAIQRRYGWHRKNLIFWGLQVPTITTPVLSFFFATGGFVSIWVRPSPWAVGVNAAMGSTFSLHIFAPGPVTVGVNIVALGIVVFLSRAQGSGVLAPVVNPQASTQCSNDSSPP